MSEQAADVPVSDLEQGPWVLIGLDGEMSSADIVTGGKLIQAGAAAWSGPRGSLVETFTSLIRQVDMEWSDRAAQVHGLSREQVDEAPEASEVDDAFHAWLIAHGGVEGRRILVPVGLNVASFDMPFFREALPRSAALFARRAVDINALCFTYEGWDPNPRCTTPRDFAGWKRSFKSEANARLAAAGVPVREHDAGFDAAQALVGWWWLRSQSTSGTTALAAALDQLDAADPLRAVLGGGLLARLANVDRMVLQLIVDALPAAVSPRKWFGQFQQGLDSTPLDAVTTGRVAEVVAAAAKAAGPR